MVATTTLEVGSILKTAALSDFESQTDPNPTPSHPGPGGTVTLAIIGSADIGSGFVTAVALTELIKQESRNAAAHCCCM
jgi:hypothetical protein